MKDSPRSSRSRSRVKSKSHILLYTVCASTILFVSIFYFYTKEKSVNAHSNGQQIIIETTDNGIEKTQTSLKNSVDIKLRSELVSAGEKTSAALPVVMESAPLLSTNISTIQSATGQSVEESDNINKQAVKKTDFLIQHLNSFYYHLDQQSYMKEFSLHRPSKDHFSTLLQNLINSPPVVAGETNDLFTLLKNTAHFFRILGKENIIILKGILDREKASFEDILKTFYTLTDYPEALKQEYGLTISQEALYEYAGFFLNTMGGRLYLFRRNSASRMTVSYYAIQIIDRANKQGNNRLGINLPPSIDFLINEMENTGNNLLLKEAYLDSLYDLKEFYN